MARKPRRGSLNGRSAVPKRDYKAEYQRRVAAGRKAGKSRQAARGHKAKEHVERARKTQQRYGVTPYMLGKLRKAARDRLRGVWQKAAKNPVNDATVERGIRILGAEDL